MNSPNDAHNVLTRDGQANPANLVAWVGHFVFSLIVDIEVTLVHLITEGNLVCSRVSANGIMKETGQTVSWTENHFYQVDEGKIVEWWGEGGPPARLIALPAASGARIEVGGKLCG